MKKLLLILLCMPLIGFGQTETVKKYYDSGQLWSEMNYNNDKKEGISKFYYKNGQLQVELNLKDGKLDSLFKWYYENGNLELEWNYIDIKQEGFWRAYSLNGNLLEEGNRKGQLDLNNNIFVLIEQIQSMKTECREEITDLDSCWLMKRIHLLMVSGTQKAGIWKYPLREETWLETPTYQRSPISEREYYNNGQLKMQFNWGIEVVNNNPELGDLANMYLPIKINQECWDEEGNEIECPKQ